MSSLGSPNPFFIAGKKAYEVERSLRFNDDDSAYLSRTPSSAGNRKKWTFSAWIKRGNLTNTMRIFGGNANASHIFFYGDNVYWDLAPEQSGTSAANLVAARKTRDVGAWFHLVCALDTDESTANNRMRMYINGAEITDFGSRTNPSSGYANNSINNNTLHTIGYRTGGQGSAGIGFDGYMAEINFIDGQQYDASYFGETDAITGQWNPKKYTGSYGTNGFYLNFSTDTLGTDRSGNNNDFTPNNFSVVAGAGNDALSDTPTNNFATMNPLVPSPSVTWANGNLDLGGSSSTQYNQTNTSTFGVTSGKWYAEVKVTYSTNNVYVGICPISAKSNENMTGSVTDAAVLRMSNETYIEGTEASSGTSISSGNIIGIALDMDNQKVWFSVQGTYILSGNPSTGANATFDGITAGETIAICARPLNGTLNFNFGQRDFEYTPPTGFKTLCSANLSDPTILDPTKHFETRTYTGTGSGNTQTLTGFNFAPDWVWGKRRTSAINHGAFDTVRGATNRLWPNLTNAEASDNSITAFTSDGYTVSTDAFNNSSQVTWNWNAGDTDGKTYTVTVVSDSGNKYRFDGFGTSAVTLDLAEGGTYIFNYPSAHPFRFSETADGTHGGGSEYTTGVTVLSSTSIQIVVAASAPNLNYYCSSHSGMGGAINTNSTLGSSNFDGSKQTLVKANASAGFSIISYTGDGSSGATTGHGLGIAPKIMFHKDRDQSNNWYTITTAVDGSADYLYLNSASGASNSSVTVPTSSLVYFTASTESNANGRDYIMYAFSEVAGYSKIGSYIGNGSTDGAFVFCGFRPAWVLLKKTNASDNWTIFDNKRDINNPMHHRIVAQSNGSENTTLSNSQDQIDFLSNGFKLRSTSNNHNGTNSTNIFLAFAESPFKNARAR